METQRELDYCILSFNGKVYHIVLLGIEGNSTLCKKECSVVPDGSLTLTGKSSLVNLANVVWPQIPRPGTLCKQCLSRLTRLHDKDHIGGGEYEELVLRILQECYERRGRRILDAKQGKSNIWVGQSGCEHQIDVSLELDNEIVLAECKSLNKAVDLPLVLTFLARIMDIKPAISGKFVHGVIFSSIGFQGGSEGNIGRLERYYHDYIALQIVYSYGRDYAQGQ